MVIPIPFDWAALKSVIQDMPWSAGTVPGVTGVPTAGEGPAASGSLMGAPTTEKTAAPSR